jgi:hypothetical protein
MSFADHVMSVKFPQLKRPLIEDDVIKAIKFKLNNEGGAWKRQVAETPNEDEEDGKSDS